jgi:hypothetical protein
VTRAVRVFKVTRRGITVRLRVLPTARDVTRDYMAGLTKFRRAGGEAQRLARGDQVQGYTAARVRVYVATITLPLSGWTPGLVAHEVLHVATAFGHTNQGDDEPMAYFVGDMVDSICNRLRRLEGER